MKIRQKRKTILLVLLATYLFLFLSVFAFAEDEKFESANINTGETYALQVPAGQVTGSSATLLNFVIGAIVKFLTLVAGLIKVAIDFGNKVLELEIVENGVKIITALANLGFVLAIIIIAFATIFRFESYQMKKILWKLVVAALLVNFSLVIAGVFISVSNLLSDFFLLKINGDLGTALANILNPQKLAESQVKAPGLLNFLVLDLDLIFKYLISLVFIIIFALFVLLIFIAIFIMLIIRVITLAFLLISMPIVWLLWIFPDTAKYWQRWWSKFLRWTFFAPIMLFFIYLVIGANQKMSETVNNFSNNAPAGVKTAFIKDMALPEDFFSYVAKLIIVGGFLIGSLIAANKLGITGAKEAMGAAQKAGRAFGGYVGRKGLQFGTGWLRKPRGEEGKEKSYAERIAEWSAKSKLTKIPVIGTVPGLAVRGIARLSAAGGEDLVKKAKEAAAKRSFNENIAMLGYTDAPNRQGILQHLQENDLLEKVPNVLKYLDEKYKNEFARFGQGRAYSAIEKSLGMNIAMKEALKEKDVVGFQKEAKKFLSELSDEERNKLPYNAIFGEKPVFGLDRKSVEFLADNITKSILEVNSGDVRKILVNVTPQNFERAHSAITRANSKIREVDPEKADEVLLALKKTLFKLKYYGGEKEDYEEEKKIIT